MADFAKALQHLRPRPEPQPRLFTEESPIASLTRQLGFLKARGTRQTADAALREPFRTLPAGEEEATPSGRHYVARNVYDQDHYHGKVRLDRFSCTDLARLTTLFRHSATVPDRDRIVFLDTETTGIQGGTGTCPFLVGLGFFSGSDFHMIQYFMRDFDEEFSMLHAVRILLQRFDLLVTYNGAAFDVPLLESRFRLARQESPFSRMAHLDLLPGARKLWRLSQGSCRLASLERRVVSFFRGPDVPGSMIPRAYFEFIQGKDCAIIPAVFTHNVHDVLSLAALTVCACDRVTGEPAQFDDPLDLYSLARILESTGDWHRSISFYERALSAGLPPHLHQKGEENLAVLCRRAGRHDRALAVCEELMQRPAFSMAGFEGAAIYHERIARNGLRALEVIDLALSRLIEDTPQHRRWRLSLSARRERLRQKVISF